mmetsp:Transcript_33879/g.82149  ORF Transcript_33879/g.82149 Transcript_33879/m.82149 type:complete len:87 (+) Transcript_33879:767-1027(+)
MYIKSVSLTPKHTTKALSMWKMTGERIYSAYLEYRFESNLAALGFRDSPSARWSVHCLEVSASLVVVKVIDIKTMQTELCPALVKV